MRFMAHFKYDREITLWLSSFMARALPGTPFPEEVPYVLMFTKNWSEGTAVENLDQRSSRRPSHGIQRGAEKERPRDIHQVRP